MLFCMAGYWPPGCLSTHIPPNIPMWFTSSVNHVELFGGNYLPKHPVGPYKFGKPGSNACMHALMFAYIRMCMHACIFLYMCTNCLCMYVYVHVYVMHTCTYMYACMNVSMCYNLKKQPYICTCSCRQACMVHACVCLRA